ncbi:uncharacterized protein LOC103705371 [Phoenix dactylifera]|uniref:Uncharacterized protein LOC103705371 n=1 Tax=Phoenix dactylifera TaxID=42345 RepID=A0A8B7BX81_PHODC|nr:uncharacterized protein LOC103705371 [Phoenix dactylifera]
MENDEDANRLGWGATRARPAVVSFGLLSARCLSSCFSETSRVVPVARRTLAWVSLQGRLVGAQEATSASAVGQGLSPVEAAAWEIFSPLHRVLIVAIVAVAVAESKKSQKISQLRRSADLRDQVLLSMQQKLDDLCEQLNSSKYESMENARESCPVDDQFAADGMLKQKGAAFCSHDHPFPELNPESGIIPLSKNLSTWTRDVNETDTAKDDVFKTTHVNIGEQEERRMSDLSDICSSITSSMDIQLSALAEGQEFYNLRKECEEKDATIKELTAAAHASSAAASKRIAELEEIIKRKNMVITRLKKDMVVLEQKAIQLMRLQRPSSAASNSSLQLPVMASNILYDLSSTSPSSSDSDSPVEHKECRRRSLVTHDSPQWYKSGAVTSLTSAKSCGSSNISTDRFPNQHSVSPAKESRDPHKYDTVQDCSAEAIKSQAQPSANSASSLSRSRDSFLKRRSVNPVVQSYSTHRADSAVALKPRRSESSGGDFKRARRHNQSESKSRVSQKRWV